MPLAPMGAVTLSRAFIRPRCPPAGSKTHVCLSSGGNSCAIPRRAVSNWAPSLKRCCGAFWQEFWDPPIRRGCTTIATHERPLSGPPDCLEWVGFCLRAAGPEGCWPPEARSALAGQVPSFEAKPVRSGGNATTGWMERISPVLCCVGEYRKQRLS